MASHDTSAAARASVERDRTSGSPPPSTAAAAHPILALQRVVGNQATGRLLAASAEREDGEVQPLAERLAQGRGAGDPLADAARTFLEPRLGYDLGAVRVHHDAAADDIAGAVNATAFTTGTDLYFRSGAYDPHSLQGMHLLAHEVTHVVQQSQGPVSGDEGPDGLAVSDPRDAFEREAESVADAMMAMPDAGRGEAPASLPAGNAAQAAAVQRSDDDDGWFGGIGDLIESAGSSASDAAGEVWDAGSSAVSSAGSAIASGAEAAWDFGSDAASGVASAASTAYHGMQAAGHAVHGATEWVEGGIGDLAAMSRQGWDMMAEQAQGIPVVEDLARGAAWVGGNTADFTGGVLKGATGLVGGLAGMVVNPVDTAIGLEGMAEHIRTIPGMANPLQVAHGLYNVVANGADLGGEMNRTLNPIEQMRGDTAMMESLVRGISRPYVDAYNRGNYGEMAGRGAIDLALLLSGVGEAGAAAEGAEALGAVGEGMRGAGVVGEGLEGAAVLGEGLEGAAALGEGAGISELAGLSEAEMGAAMEQATALGEGTMASGGASSEMVELQTQNSRLEQLRDLADSGDVRGVATDPELAQAYEGAQQTMRSPVDKYPNLRNRMNTQIEQAGGVPPEGDWHHWRYQEDFPAEAIDPQNLYPTNRAPSPGSAIEANINPTTGLPYEPHTQLHQVADVPGTPRFQQMADWAKPTEIRDMFNFWNTETPLSEIDELLRQWNAR